MARAMISPKFYAWDRDGKPLAFGKVYTYQARTNTPKATYQSEDQVVANTNPVILNGEGYANIYLDGSYKIVVKDKDENEIWSADPVTQGKGDGDTYSQFTLTGFYVSPTIVKVLGDYTSAILTGMYLTLTTSLNSIKDKDESSTVLSSSFNGEYTEIQISNPIVTTSVKTISVTNWPFDEISAIEEFVESDDDYFETPQGELKKTISGVIKDGEEAAKNIGGIDIGNYDEGIEISKSYEYVVFERSTNPSQWKVKYGVPLPYVIDTLTYPTPQSDPNLQEFNNVNSETLRQYSTVFFGTISDMISFNLDVGNSCYILGRDSIGDGGSSWYVINPPQSVDEQNDVTLDNGNVAIKQASEFKSLSLGDRDVPPGDQPLFVRQNVVDPSQTVAAQFQRIAKVDTGINPKCIRAYTRVEDPVGATEWALSGELDNYSDTSSTGNTATSGVSKKFGLATVFAGHFQSKDFNEYALPDDVTALNGVEINLPAIGPDNPTQNNGFGVRNVLDIIAVTNTDVNPLADDCEIGMGIRIRCDNGNRSTAFMRYGIVLEDGIGGNPNPMTNAIRIKTTGQRGVHITGNKTVADILCEGDSATGIAMNGSYTTSAIRIPADQFYGFENTNAIKMGWVSGASELRMQNAGVPRFGFNMSAAPFLRVNNLKVIAERKTGWATPSGTANRTSYDTTTVTLEELAERVKALLDDLHADSGHGLIGS